MGAVGGEQHIAVRLENILTREDRSLTDKAWDVLHFFLLYGDEFEWFIHIMAEKIKQNVFYANWHYLLHMIQSDEVKSIVDIIYDMWFSSEDEAVEFNTCLWAFNDLQKQYEEYDKNCNCDHEYFDLFL